MLSSDVHLEKALEEYNEKINELELEGTREELLEALVNRSTVLMLMESYASSMDDAEEAIRLAEEMESLGKKINTGTYIKMYENHGQMIYGEDEKTMLSDYMKIVPKLSELGDDVRHYDKRGLISMCIGCAEDLLDFNYNENCVSFLDKAVSLVGDNDDIWSENRRLQIANLFGQIDENMGLLDDAFNSFTEAISIGTRLYKKKKIDDEMDLVFSFTYRGDICEKKEMKEKMWDDYEDAISILEELNTMNKLKDKDLLVNLHQTLATSMMDAGKIERAEKHLMRVVNLGVPGMKEAIDELGINQR